MKLLLVIILTALSSLTAWLYGQYEFHVSYLIVAVSFFIAVYYGLNRILEKNAPSLNNTNGRRG